MHCRNKSSLCSKCQKTCHIKSKIAAKRALKTKVFYILLYLLIQMFMLEGIFTHNQKVWEIRIDLHAQQMRLIICKKGRNNLQKSILHQQKWPKSAHFPEQAYNPFTVCRPTRPKVLQIFGQKTCFSHSQHVKCNMKTGQTSLSIVNKEFIKINTKKHFLTPISPFLAKFWHFCWTHSGFMHW